LRGFFFFFFSLLFTRLAEVFDVVAGVGWCWCWLVGWHLSFVIFFFGFCFSHSSFSLSDLELLLFTSLVSVFLKQ